MPALCTSIYNRRPCQLLRARACVCVCVPLHVCVRVCHYHDHPHHRSNRHHHPRRLHLSVDNGDLLHASPCPCVFFLFCCFFFPPFQFHPFMHDHCCSEIPENLKMCPQLFLPTCHPPHFPSPHSLLPESPESPQTWVGVVS